jgi:hypothetical protein
MQEKLTKIHFLKAGGTILRITGSVSEIGIFLTHWRLPESRALRIIVFIGLSKNLTSIFS